MVASLHLLLLLPLLFLLPSPHVDDSHESRSLLHFHSWDRIPGVFKAITQPFIPFLCLLI